MTSAMVCPRDLVFRCAVKVLVASLLGAAKYLLCAATVLVASLFDAAKFIMSTIPS